MAPFQSWDASGGRAAEARVLSSRACPDDASAKSRSIPCQPAASSRLASSPPADVEIEIVLFFLVFLEEDVGVVLADVLDVLDVLDIGDLFLGSPASSASASSSETISGASGSAASTSSTSSSSSSSSSRSRPALRAGGVLLEIGARIRFAGIGRDDRILVQIVELLAGIGVFPLGAAVVFGQCCFLMMLENAGPPARVVRLG